jgi:hypothetical protein
MGNQKFCFSKSVGIIVGIVILLILGTSIVSQLPNQQTTSNTRAARPSQATCEAGSQVRCGTGVAATCCNLSTSKCVAGKCVQSMCNNAKYAKIDGKCYHLDWRVCGANGTSCCSDAVDMSLCPATTPSVLQPYFDAMQEYADTHGGECQVNPDCMPPDLCLTHMEGKKRIGVCITPTPTSRASKNQPL